MSRLLRAIAIGAGIGIAGAGVVAAPIFLQSALANDNVQAAAATVAAPIEQLFPAAPAFDMARLRKFDFSFDASVATTPLSTVTISKYGFGQRSVVTISKTPTGTYSSDAIASPYVRYPGISATARADDCTCLLHLLEGLKSLPTVPVEQYGSSFLDVPAPQATGLITWL